eukprot:4320659-Pleurochrysis_carterae.AAC.1
MRSCLSRGVENNRGVKAHNWKADIFEKQNCKWCKTTRLRDFVPVEDALIKGKKDNAESGGCWLTLEAVLIIY